MKTTKRTADKIVQVILTYNGKRLRQQLLDFPIIQPDCPVAAHYNQSEAKFREWLQLIANSPKGSMLVKASVCFFNFPAREIPGWFRNHSGKFYFNVPPGNILEFIE